MTNLAISILAIVCAGFVVHAMGGGVVTIILSCVIVALVCVIVILFMCIPRWPG